MLQSLSYERLENINLKDKFFNSLKNNYCEFEDWLTKNQDHYAYIERENDDIKGFLYLTLEKGIIEEINSAIIFQKIVNIKIIELSSNKKALAECFIKKSIDYAIFKETNRIFVSLNRYNKWLIDLFKTYGFRECNEIIVNERKEVVLLKDLQYPSNDIRNSYPKINLNSKAYILPMFKENHDRHFPNTIYRNECKNIVEDISPTNSIEKLHITKFDEVYKLNKGDILLIYKKSDALVPADYKSLASCICVVDEVRKIASFGYLEDFKNYCKNYKSYNEEELNKFFYNKEDSYAIKMTFNAILSKRITRHDLIEVVNLTKDAYWGFFEISKEKLEDILELGNLDKAYIKD